MGKENAVMISTFVGAIVDLILNAIFIPHFGAEGAAIGTLVAELVVLIVQLIYLKEDVVYLYSNQGYIKMVVALIFATISAYIVKIFINVIFLKLVVSAVMFFGIYLVMLYIMKEDVVTENVNRIIDKVSRRKK